MFSSLWFLIKSVGIILILGWLFSIGGGVIIDAFDYKITAHFGAFVVLLIIAFYVLTLIGRAVRTIIYTPRTLSEGYKNHKYKRGMQALTYGLSAVAAGDVKTAKYYTKRANRFLNDDHGLVALLTGLSSRLSGDEKLSKQSFQKLLKREETSFLGLRGLLQTAFDHGDYKGALILTRHAYEKNPKQSWIIKTLYRLELKQRNIDRAFDLLKQIAKLRLFDDKHIKSDRAAIAMAHDDINTAFQQSQDFLPAGLIMTETFIKDGKVRKAKQIIEKLWKVNPHPKLVELWISIAPQKTLENPLRILSHVEDLQRINKDNASCNLYVSRIALRYDFIKQARRFTELAIENKPTMQAYQMMARIEPTAGWSDMIPTATQDKCWICIETKRVFENWQAFNDENGFNTIHWQYPDQIHTMNNQDKNPSPLFLTEPQK
jgi:HemY protein